jgi:hypothetical protein
LEVTGGKDGGSYWVNKQKGTEVDHRDQILTLAGFTVNVHRNGPHQVGYRIDLGLGSSDAVGIATFKDFVEVNLKAVHAAKFLGSVGLMGNFPKGELVGRDGESVFQDTNDFSKEWQVLSNEPLLFHSTEGSIHHPQECAMPKITLESSRKLRRRLGEVMTTEEDVERACAHADADSRDACIFDVLATNDKDLAGAY